MSAAIRCACPQDAEGIYALVASHFRRGELLPRTFFDIQNNLDDWVVATEGEIILGCGSLLEFTSTLSEVRSLVVVDHARRIGIGTALVHALVAKATGRGIRTLLAVTRAVPFFEQAGFRSCSKSLFPEKVWRDCLLCAQKDSCDEQAVMMDLDQQTPFRDAIPPQPKEGEHHV